MTWALSIGVLVQRLAVVGVRETSATVDFKEGDIEWAVVDPRRHIMYVWDKEVHGREDFVVVAKELGASVVTNSSFNIYQGGDKWWATLKVGAHLVVESFWAKLTYTLGGMMGTPYVEDDRVREIELENWRGSHANGHIFGTHESIAEALIDRPTMHWFGRGGGRLFPNYDIRQGEAPRIDEVVGGLFRTVDNYTDVEAEHQTIGSGFWGLAPLSGDRALEDVGIAAAVDGYEANDGLAGEDKPRCTGLLITVFGYEDVKRIAELLIAARTKDAVRVDGNDSILLGHGDTLVYGDVMMDPKRLLDRWGYQFQKG